MINHSCLYDMNRWAKNLDITFEMLFDYITTTIYSKKKVVKINSIKSLVLGGIVNPFGKNSFDLLRIYANVVFKDKNIEYPINATYTISAADKELKIFIREHKIKSLFEDKQL